MSTWCLKLLCSAAPIKIWPEKHLWGVGLIGIWLFVRRQDALVNLSRKDGISVLFYARYLAGYQIQCTAKYLRSNQAAVWYLIYGRIFGQISGIRLDIKFSIHPDINIRIFVQISCKRPDTWLDIQFLVGYPVYSRPDILYPAGWISICPDI